MLYVINQLAGLCFYLGKTPSFKLGREFLPQNELLKFRKKGARSSFDKGPFILVINSLFLRKEFMSQKNWLLTLKHTVP